MGAPQAVSYGIRRKGIRLPQVAVLCDHEGDEAGGSMTPRLAIAILLTAGTALCQTPQKAAGTYSADVRFDISRVAAQDGRTENGAAINRTWSRQSMIDLDW
jgi:hypothetical protein